MNRLIKLERVNRREIGGQAEWGWSATAIGPHGYVYGRRSLAQTEALSRAGISTDAVPPLPECIWGIFHNEHSITPGWLCGWINPAGVQWEQADTPKAAVELALRQHAACADQECETLTRCIRLGCKRRCGATTEVTQ